MARAGEYRVNLTIDYSPESTKPEPNRTAFQRGFPAVVQYVDILNVTIPGDLFDTFPAIPADALRRLEVINFTMAERKPGFGEPLRPSIDFVACDRLHTVSLSGEGWTGFIQRGLISNMPWARLAVLRLTEGYLNGALARDIFFQCRNLEECTLDIAISNPMWWLTATTSESAENAKNGDIFPATHPLLTSLAITFHGAKKIVPFFHGLTLPALKYLEVNTMLSEGEDVPSVLLALQSRSAFSLLKLTLHTAYFMPEKLLQLLRALPTLVTLSLSYCYFLKSEIIAALIYSTSSLSVLLPNLKYLHARDIEMLVHDTLVLDMIESRRPKLQVPYTGVAELASVKVFVDEEMGNPEFDQQPSPETMQRGVELSLAGLVMDYPRLTTGYWLGLSEESSSDWADSSDEDVESEEEDWQISSDEISSSTHGSSSSESEGSSENIESGEELE